MEGEFALVDAAMEAEEAADAAASTSTGAGTLGVLGLAAGDPKAKSEGRLPSGWLYDEAIAMYVNRTTGETSKDRPYDKCVARPEHRCYLSPYLTNASCTPFGRCGTFGCILRDRHPVQRRPLASTPAMRTHPCTDTVAAPLFFDAGLARVRRANQQ